MAIIQNWQQAEDATQLLPRLRPTPHVQPTQSERARTLLLPGKRAIFRAYPNMATPGTMMRLERHERVVFALLDGRRAIGDVARLTHQSDMSVASSVVHLYQQGFIEYIQG